MIDRGNEKATSDSWDTVLPYVLYALREKEKL